MVPHAETEAETMGTQMKKSLLFMFLAVLLLVAACGEDDAGGDSGDGPTEILSVEALRERADEFDGETVTVRSNYWSDGERQYLSDIMMESYPPQIPFDQSIVLHGDVPDSVLEMLTTAEPPYTGTTWGEVDVTGKVSVEGDEVHLHIEEIGVVQA